MNPAAEPAAANCWWYCRRYGYNGGGNPAIAAAVAGGCCGGPGGPTLKFGLGNGGDFGEVAADDDAGGGGELVAVVEGVEVVADSPISELTSKARFGSFGVVRG